MEALHMITHKPGWNETGEHQHGRRRYNDEGQQMLADRYFVKPGSGSGPRPFGFFQGHMFFHDFKREYAGTVAYFNVVRNPVHRCISEYYWTTRKMFSPKAAGQYLYKNINVCTREECFRIPEDMVVATPYHDVSAEPKGGSREAMRAYLKENCNNYYVRWFCGHDDVCMDPASDRAYKRALANLRDKHLIVGVTEEMGLTLRGLAKLLPDAFGDLHTVAPAIFDAPPVLHKERYDPPTTSTVEELTRLNQKDIALYEAIKQRLYTQAKTCGF